MNNNQWELYTSVDGYLDVNEMLDKAYDETFKRVQEELADCGDNEIIAKTIFDEMYDLMGEYERFGATDTEPRDHLIDTINDALGTEIFKIHSAGMR